MDSMIYILKDRIIRIEWTILKGTSHVREDFRRANVKVFLIGNTEKYYLEATAEDGILKFDIPQGLEEGTYGIEAIWVKNEGHLGMGNRSISRSKKERLFSITEFEEEATNLGDGEVVLKFTSSTATYGYDGLSSYELAVLRGEWTGTEGEWLKHQRYVSVLNGRGDSETDTMSQKSITEELEAHDEAIEANKKAIEENKKEFDEYTEETDDRLDDVEERLDYIPKESFLSSDPAAGFNTSDVIEEDCVADRAIADRFGRRIDEEYVTRDSVKNYTQEVVDGSKMEIMPGSVVPESLSPAVKQMIEAGAGKPGSITNLPDEEDITVTDANTLQFKDKEYNPYNYSGMGRVYLRKHIVNGTNILTQHMINKPNTVYIIQYDYCLADQTIEIPENCVLQFEGGSLRNGSILCNYTKIIYSNKIILYDVYLKGTIENDYIKTTAFGNNNTSTINKTIEYLKNIKNITIGIEGTYNHDETINLNKYTRTKILGYTFIKMTENVTVVNYTANNYEFNWKNVYIEVPKNNTADVFIIRSYPRNKSVTPNTTGEVVEGRTKVYLPFIYLEESTFSTPPANCNAFKLKNNQIQGTYFNYIYDTEFIINTFKIKTSLYLNVSNNGSKEFWSNLKFSIKASTFVDCIVIKDVTENIAFGDPVFYLQLQPDSYCNKIIKIENYDYAKTLKNIRFNWVVDFCIWDLSTISEGKEFQLIDNLPNSTYNNNHYIDKRSSRFFANKYANLNVFKNEITDDTGRRYLVIDSISYINYVLFVGISTSLSQKDAFLKLIENIDNEGYDRNFSIQFNGYQSTNEIYPNVRNILSVLLDDNKNNFAGYSYRPAITTMHFTYSNSNGKLSYIYCTIDSIYFTLKLSCSLVYDSENESISDININKCIENTFSGNGGNIGIERPTTGYSINSTYLFYSENDKNLNIATGIDENNKLKWDSVLLASTEKRGEYEGNMYINPKNRKPLFYIDGRWRYSNGFLESSLFYGEYLDRPRYYLTKEAIGSSFFINNGSYYPIFIAKIEKDELNRDFSYYVKADGTNADIPKSLSITNLREFVVPEFASIGAEIFCTSTKEKYMWNGENWVRPDGTYFDNSKVGNTSNRPISNLEVGFLFYDTTLKKPIWWTGEKWVDATGAEV